MQQQDALRGYPGIGGGQAYKGKPVRVYDRTNIAGLSDVAVDCQQVNAAYIELYPIGGAGSVSISVEGAASQGGIYTQLADPNAAAQTITTADAFDVIVGSAWLKVRLASITGLWTVIVTPYVSPGQSRIALTSTVNVLDTVSGYDTSTEIGVDVTTSAAVAVAANADRKFLLLTNNSDTDMMIGIGSEPTTTTGIPLTSYGGAYVMSRGFKNVDTAAIYAIHGGTGNKRLTGVEGA